IAVTVLRIAVLGFGVVILLWHLAGRNREFLVSRRITLQIAIPCALLSVLGPLLSMQLLLQQYPTAIPLDTFRATTALMLLVSLVFAFLLMGAAAALLTSFYPGAVAALRARNR